MAGEPDLWTPPHSLSPHAHSPLLAKATERHGNAGGLPGPGPYGPLPARDQGYAGANKFTEFEISGRRWKSATCDVTRLIVWTRS